MIRFRKGGPDVSQSGSAAQTAMSGGSGADKSGASSLEWWQTPERFKRRLIDEKEIEIINVS